MKYLIVAAIAILLSASSFADEPTIEQREALKEMYNVESILAHCPFTINFDKIDRDLSGIDLSITDYCPNGRFNAFAMPHMNESLSNMMKRLRSDQTELCAQADRRYGLNGSERKGWLKKSGGPAGEPSSVPLCTLNRE